MRKLILVPLAMSICMSMSGCPKLSIDFERNNARETEAAFDQRIEFNYEVQDGTMVNGFISDGNGVVINTQPTGQTPTESGTPATSSELVGTWNTVHRSGNYLYRYYIEFYADGTFTQGNTDYTHTSYEPQLFPDQFEGWHAIPMGFPFSYGTYTVEGNTITMVTLGDDVDSITAPETNTLTIESMNGQTAQLTKNGATNQYLKNFTPTNQDKFVEELAAALGVDLSI